MTKNSKDPRKQSRRSFTRSALTAVGAVSALSLVDKISAEPQRSGPAQQKDVDRQSSPITVGGGGSVGIDFNSSYFALSSGQTGFSHAGDTLHKLWLIDKYGALENITPEHENCRIRIQCKRGSKLRTIEIIGDPLGLNFDTVEFPKKQPDGGRKEIHHNKKYKIIKIEVEDRVTNQTTPHEVPTKGKCTIVVVNSL